MDNVKLSDIINKLRSKIVDKLLVKTIVKEYNEHPHFVIKYVSVYYPDEFSQCVKIATHNSQWEKLYGLTDSVYLRYTF